MTKKNNSVPFCLFLIFLILLISTLTISVSAHSIIPWSQTYTANNATNTNAFAIGSYPAHISGTNMSYVWANNSSRQLLNDALRNSFNTMWKGLLVCTETTQSNAHIVLKYDPLSAPANAAATAYRKAYDENHHIRLGGNDAEIVYHACVSGYTYKEKIKISAHEVGHIWGIADLYNTNKNLPSIYSQPYEFDKATRHDRNALRICLNNLWYNPGSGGVWKYQQTPGSFLLRGDVDMDNSITAADSRLVLQYSAQLTTLSSIQKKLADVDNDSSITASDSRYILQYSSQTISRFPADVDE